MFFDVTWQILAAAFILDILAGDPKWLPHPIIWMGRAISFFEPEFRKRFENPFKAGLFFALCLIAAAFGLTWAIVLIAEGIHPVAGAEGFIEFFNPLDTAVDLEGHFLSDDPAQLQKHRISTSIPVSPLAAARNMVDSTPDCPTCAKYTNSPSGDHATGRPNGFPSIDNAGVSDIRSII